MKQTLITLSAIVGALLIEVGLITQGRSVSNDAYLGYHKHLAEQLKYDLALNQTILEVQQV